jgi:uncharacterized protein involved in exopolysaccharide biosynthesis
LHCDFTNGIDLKKGIMQEQTTEQQSISELDFWRVIGKRKKLIIWLTIVIALTSAVFSLFLPNIYESAAVITTVAEKDTTTSAAMQMLSASGLAAMADVAGLSFPGGQKLNVLESYLKSNVVREKVITRHDLLPILFPKQWDNEKRTWKRSSPGLMTKTVTALSRVVSPNDTAVQKPESDGAPSISDGLRALQPMVTVKSNVKANTLTISVDHRDPKIAADLVAYILDALQDHLSEEKKKNANENRAYLKEQLVRAVDPMTRQKIYSLLSKQIETALMAEVKGNIFTIIDPPRVPDRKVKPNRSQLVMMSIVMSLFIGVFLAFFLEKREQAKVSRQKEQGL